MSEVKKEGYILRVLIAIDQLGNAIAGGHPDITISARTGYFSRVKKTKFRMWWRTLESVIDFTFLPIDGANHCYQSYLSDEQDGKHREGNDIARALLGVGVIVVCVPLSIVTRVVVLFKNLL